MDSLAHGQMFCRFSISNMTASILMFLVSSHLFSRYLNSSHHAKADINLSSQIVTELTGRKNGHYIVSEMCMYVREMPV